MTPQGHGCDGRPPSRTLSKSFVHAASPLSDVPTLRSRARQHIEEGAVTDSYGADRETVLRLLNEALATEIVCSLRYKRHYYTATGIHAQSVAAEFRRLVNTVPRNGLVVVGVHTPEFEFEKDTGNVRDAIVRKIPSVLIVGRREQAAGTVTLRARGSETRRTLAVATFERQLLRTIEERRRELWLEGHRINDMQRLNLPWRTGFDHKGREYGADITCFPLPLSELNNNPHLRG